MKKTAILMIILVILAVVSAYSLEFTFIPGMEIPFGDTTGGNLYSVGAGGSIVLGHGFSVPSWLYLEGGFGYCINGTDGNAPLHRILAEAGAGVSFVLAPRWNLRLVGTGGYSYAFYSGDLNGSQYHSSMVIGGRLDSLFALSAGFNLGFGVTYRYTPNLYQGLSVSLAARVSLGSTGGDGAEFRSIITEPVYPILYWHYTSHPFGSAVLQNGTGGRMENVSVSVYVHEYMKGPMECAAFDSIGRGESVEVPLTTLFSDRILTVLEATKVTVEYSVSYTYLGREYTVVETEALLVQNRNALTWSDDRMVTSFVSAKDPQVMRFARSAATAVGDLSLRPVSESFRLGLAICEAMRLHGMNYVRDPQTPYAELSLDSGAVDYLQFPTQSLEFRTGDCDDLSILYNSLLESVAVETAFITVPGHIFPAFDLGMTPAEAERVIGSSDDLIIADGRAWIPVEITALEEGFLRAWYLGAKKWREASSDGSGALIPTHSGWEIYPPVSRPADEDVTITAPGHDALADACVSSLERFVNRSIAGREAELLARIQAGRNVAGSRNSLGVLYGRYGLLDKAGDQFTRLPDSTGKFVNLGNIALLQDDPRTATSHFSEALNLDPDNPSALSGMTRASYELEDYRASDEALARLEEVAPELAERHAYLGSDTGGARAASHQREAGVVWEE